MNQFFRRQKAFYKRLLSKVQNGAADGSLRYLNISQFLGAMNDNIFKLILVFMAIDVEGKERASTILSGVGAIYVIPFLLFSSIAGSLADRFSKQKILAIMKTIEVITMFLAIFAFAYKSIWAGFTLLFLLATHSAMFGPPKYGIISEIVPPERVAKANGLITGFTYLAIIAGTFLASFLTEMTGRRFAITAGFCLLMSLFGFISIFGIKKTRPQDSKKRMSPFFLHEIFHTLRFCLTKKHLLVTVLASSYFLFIGAFTQLNIIPFAMQSLHLTDVFGGYLFLSTALGIAIGSYLAGKAAKQEIELGLTCLAGLAISLIFILLALFSSHLVITIILLTLLGVFGGAFIIPSDSFTQLASPQEKRGQVIAAANFLSFCGVLLASFCLYLFSNILEVSSATGFAIIGISTFFVSLLLVARLSDFAFPYFAKKLTPFLHLRIHGMELLEKNPSSTLVLKDASLRKSMILLDLVPKTQFFVPVERSEGVIRLFNRLIYSLHFVQKGELEKMVLKSRSLQREHHTPCFLLFKENRALTPTHEKISKKRDLLTVEIISLPGKPTSVSFSQLD